ncbi:MAG: DUF255 domain-containing protein [Chromatiales bacterium]|jgi:uncharacterized protein YyaL (SSP411 family)
MLTAAQILLCRAGQYLRRILFRQLLVAGCLFISLTSAAAPLWTNLLAGHASPYLAMHGEDPVHWQQWDKSVLERAQADNKLIFISSGYFSCHWCHVMQRESYRNAELAAFLNEHFIAVKIDRELRPALDAYLIDFVERSTGVAGWPLNVFLTPEGYPLLGLTYAPPEQFRQILQKLADGWQTRGAQARQLAKQAAEAMLQEQAPAVAASTAAPDAQQLLQAFVTQAMSFADELQGGFGRQSRFPMTPQLFLLLDYLQINPDESVRDFVILTLDQLASLGMRDHINGGFFRYTVDPDWRTPHFEKMLYSQAQLARLYLRAASVLHKPEYREVARDTLDFVLQKMRGKQGAYIASLSAVDRDGVEGAGYLWSRDELKPLLADDELQLVTAAWGLTDNNSVLPIQAQSDATLARSLQWPKQQVQLLQASVRRKLQLHNKVRHMPADGKQLTSWNALLLSSLSLAASEFDDNHYLHEARRLRDFLVEPFLQNGQLARARDGQQQIGRAGLEDYAYLAQALRDWSVAAESVEDWQLSNLLLAKAWLRFHAATGWKNGDEDLLPGMAGQVLLADGALPAADAVVLGLSLQSGNAPLVKKARDVLGSMAVGLSVEPFSHASHIGMLLELNPKRPD